MPLNNQSPVVTERSLAAGETTTPGLPRGITLNRQNSISGSGSGAPPDRYRLRQVVAPIPASTAGAITTSSPVTGGHGHRDIDNETKTEQVS